MRIQRRLWALFLAGLCGCSTQLALQRPPSFAERVELHDRVDENEVAMSLADQGPAAEPIQGRDARLDDTKLTFRPMGHFEPRQTAPLESIRAMTIVDRGSGARRGALIGAIPGVALFGIAAVSLAATNSNTNCGCGNFGAVIIGAGGLVLGAAGALIGAIAGYEVGYRYDVKFTEPAQAAAAPSASR